jgi:hypothetical protein
MNNNNKNVKITNVGKNVEEKEFLCSVDRNANWYSYFGVLYGDSSKNQKYIYCMIQLSYFWICIQRK